MSKATGDHRVVATNRQARRDYEILETFEAGLVLVGSEVKSLRDGRANVKDSYAELVGDELFLVHLHISPYAQAGPTGHQPERRRKLLMRRRELERLRGKLVERGFALVPLAIYFKGRWAKVELGLGRGKKQYDKRQDVAERESKREMARAMRRDLRGGGGGGRERDRERDRGAAAHRARIPRRAACLLVMLLLGTAGRALASSIPVVARFGPRVEPERVEGTLDHDTIYIPVNVVARWFGAVKDWDPATLTLTLHAAHHEIRLIPGNRWVTLDGKLINLPDAARLASGSIEVPLIFLQELAPRVIDRRVHWEPERSVLTLYPAGVNILRVDFSGSPGGSLSVHVELADSLGFQLDSSRPGEIRLRIPEGEFEPGIGEAAAPVLPVRRVTADHDGRVAELIFEMADDSGTATAVPSEGGRAIEISMGGFVPDALEPPRLDSRPFPTRPVARNRNGSKTRVIVVDPGHGGTERGAIGPTGYLEKKATLEIALRLKHLLEQGGDCRVLLTRDDDRLEPLERRSAMANIFNADLFISIHCNSWPAGEAGGFEVYVARPAMGAVGDSSQAADGGGALTPPDAVRWDQAQNAYIEESRLFAGFVREELGRLGLRDRGTRSAGFAVLRSVMAPAVLVETAFISNPDEEAKLADPAFQDQVAAALARAIQRFTSEPEPAPMGTPSG